MKRSAKVYVRFERGRDDVVGPTLGPYEYVQVTYQLLRNDQGREIAVYDGDDWNLVDFVVHEDGKIELVKKPGEFYSDFIIYTEGA